MSHSVGFHAQHKTVFRAATEKAIPCMAACAIGAYLSITAAATAIKIISIAATLIGAYCFLAIILTAIVSRNVREFEANVGKAMVVLGSQAFIEMCVQVATRALANIIDRAFDRR